VPASGQAGCGLKLPTLYVVLYTAVTEPAAQAAVKSLSAIVKTIV